MSGPSLLVLNAGSSSLKFCLYGDDAALPLLAKGQVEKIGTVPFFKIDGEEKKLAEGSGHAVALAAILDRIGNDTQLTGVAHRVVHGGTAFTGPTRVTPSVVEALAALAPLAPLHQPHNLLAIRHLLETRPDLPQVACFDTAFHAGHERLFAEYAVPEKLTAAGIRRYGFHGLSYDWIARRLQEQAPQLYAGRVVVAHLGNGSSLCALKGGRSIDTTMGMTATEGLPMGTRSGSIDPGAIFFMQRSLGMSVNEVEKTLNSESGLKGMSGLSNDVRTLLESSDPRAKFALDYFALKVAQHIALMAVSIGGIDGLVFTGGIGQHADTVRAAILERIDFLKVPEILVMPTDEERIMAQQARTLLYGKEEQAA